MDSATRMFVGMAGPPPGLVERGGSPGGAGALREAGPPSGARGDEVSPESLKEAGLAKRSGIPVKVLGRGEISTKLTVRAHAFSASAKEKIEAAGGSCEELAASGREAE